MTRSPTPKRRQPGPAFDDLAARLVAGDHALVAFGALAQVLVIDAADVGAADGGGLHAQQHFAVARLRNGHLVLQFARCCCPGRVTAPDH